MWDMRCASNGCCGLSKGTQSDGLISDTSTEELTSSSSTENLKDDKISKKLHAKQSKAAINEFQNSTDLMIQASTSLHRTQTQYQLYIQWGVLLSFGVLLWVALWVTDIFNPNPFLKEGWLADVATAKKVTLKTGIVKKPAPPVWWFQNLWNHTLNSLISVTTLDSAVFLTCITILVYLESHTRNNWRGTLVRLYCNRAEQGETDRSSFHSNISQEDVRSKEADFLSHDDDLSQFSHGDVRNLNQHNNIRGKSEMGEKSTQCLRQEETSTTENRPIVRRHSQKAAGF
ncbi:uncharacterized protein LOC124175634 [Neodiprion fabricii]|uniref:uncharacterized protein LOC124175634 n=1 Tax=Neodiprion fabricii TaxID=2872261 RepID=UPI001ED931D9|nr:uncharacterized protein LOC124175634 [Neodiprion fabricii]